jgi:hypothetical protein
MICRDPDAEHRAEYERVMRENPRWPMRLWERLNDAEKEKIRAALSFDAQQLAAELSGAVGIAPPSGKYLLRRSLHIAQGGMARRLKKRVRASSVDEQIPVPL